MQPPMIGRECCIKNWSRSSLWWPGHGPQQKISSVICLSDQGNQHLEGSFLIFLVLTNINCTNLFLNKCEYNLLIHSLRMEKCVFLCETCVAAHWGSTPHHPVFQKHDLLQSNQEILRMIWKKKRSRRSQLGVSRTDSTTFHVQKEQPQCPGSACCDLLWHLPGGMQVHPEVLRFPSQVFRIFGKWWLALKIKAGQEFPTWKGI